MFRWQLTLLITTFYISAEVNGTFQYIFPKLTAIVELLGNFIDPTIGPKQLNNNESDQEYDFIIVGSGSAGSVLANRLSEIEHWKILLIEAGRPANILNKIPLLAPIFQATGYNWNYTMEKQENICLGMNDNTCLWPRGKALGGSTILNYMIYTRGNPKDYDRWAKDNPGWSYDEVLPYFLKSEDCRLGKECTNGYHGAGGYLSTEYPFSSTITDAFIAAGQELGHNAVDYNTPDYMGFSKIQANINKGMRLSAADAFLKPIKSRTNLRIITGAKVTRILMDPYTKEAQGVEFVKNLKVYNAKANREVILSAGAFHSPQLLMLSGIGPYEHLTEIGIPVVHTLAVGKTMYDHPAFLGLTFKINQTVEPREAVLDPNEIIKFLVEGKGVLTSLAGVEALAYIKTEASREQEDYPDIELIFVGTGNIESDYGIFTVPTLNIRKDVYEQVFKPVEQIPSWTIFPMLLHPKSKGFVKLKTKNPFDPPLLYGNYYTDPDNHDMTTFLAAIRYIIRLSKTEAFQEFGSTLHEVPFPGCEQYPFNSDEYWRCALRTITVTLHHQIGTCRMGGANDPSAIVDNKLRVHGVNKLRVVDASVIPLTLSAHTSAPTMMIGEKAADLIKEEYR